MVATDPLKRDWDLPEPELGSAIPLLEVPSAEVSVPFTSEFVEFDPW